MAHLLETVIQRFIGLSTEDFPEDVPEGSTLHLVDTGEQLIWHDGMWVEDLRMARALGMLD